MRATTATQWSDDDNLCGKYRGEVTNDDEAVCCDKCDVWHHIKCENITTDTYRRMQMSDDEWFCKRCSKNRNMNLKKVLEKEIHKPEERHAQLQRIKGKRRSDEKDT